MSPTTPPGSRDTVEPAGALRRTWRFLFVAVALIICVLTVLDCVEMWM